MKYEQWQRLIKAFPNSDEHIMTGREIVITQVPNKRGYERILHQRGKIVRCKSWVFGGVGVEIYNFINPNCRSTGGLFWLDYANFEFVDCDENKVVTDLIQGYKKESEDKQMKLTGFKEAAKIIIGGKPFYYALYGSAKVKAGDKVLVTGTASGRIHTVEDVVSAEEALIEVGQPLCAEVICKVDTSAYDARIKQREQKAKLRKLMEATVAQMDEVDKFKVYADHNPEMAKLLAQYNEINV